MPLEEELLHCFSGQINGCRGTKDTSLGIGSSKPTAGAAAFSGVWIPLLCVLGICCAIGGLQQSPTEMRGYLLFLSSQNTVGCSGQGDGTDTMPKTSAYLSLGIDSRRGALIHFPSAMLFSRPPSTWLRIWPNRSKCPVGL